MTDGDVPRADHSGELDVQGRSWVRWLWIPGVLVVLALVAWWMTHPRELVTSEETVHVTAKEGSTVYVALTGRGVDGNRRLSISEVEFSKLAKGSGVELEAMICHRGSISATTDPRPFCDGVEDAEGHELDLGDGDQLIVAITADEPQTVAIKDVDVTFREGLQWGTQPVGPIVVVDVIG